MDRRATGQTMLRVGGVTRIVVTITLHVRQRS
jgi:hypothetical protein